MSPVQRVLPFSAHEAQEWEEALAYLKSRRITSEAITQFNLGYGPNQWRSVSEFLVNKKNMHRKIWSLQD